jgi:membrane protein implicated in regulation of membrane protease activity
MIAHFYGAHPFWVWASVCALLLAAEVASGSGYLLWPAAAAALVGLLGLVMPLGPVGEIAAFAGLTLVSILLARRFLPRRKVQIVPEDAEPAARLIGRFGETVGPFEGRCGRAFVDGAEWIAEIDDAAEPIAPGERIEVVDVLGAGRLKVRAA